MLSYSSDAVFRWVGVHAFGQEASRGEVLLATGAGLAAIALAVVMIVWAGLDLAWWQWLVVAVIAFDIGGGVPANATAAAARQYHRADRPWAPLLFAAGHVHPFVMAAVLPGYSWLAAAAAYGAVLVAVALTLLVPAALARPASLVISAFAIALCLPLTGAGWDWLVPLLVLKLVAAHATLGRT